MAGRAPKAYLEVRVEVPRSLADAVCDFITENIVSGLVIEQEDDAEVTGVIFYVDEHDIRYKTSLTDYLAGLVGESMAEVPRINQKLVAESDWVEKYRESIRSVGVGDDIVIRPTWVPPAGARYEIIIEPKMAFGTGSHATTSGCLLAIRQSFSKGMRFLDLGAGSGILSILADKMGARFIKAVDYDITAIENCRENFRINHVAADHEVLFGSIEKCLADTPYDFVCANIIRSTILSMLGQLFALTAASGILVLSGLLEQDEAEISAALSGLDQTDFSIMRRDEWLTYSVRRK